MLSRNVTSRFDKRIIWCTPCVSDCFARLLCFSTIFIAIFWAPGAPMASKALASEALEWADGAIPTDTTGTTWRRVRVTGRYDREREIVLRGPFTGGPAPRPVSRRTLVPPSIPPHVADRCYCDTREEIEPWVGATPRANAVSPPQRRVDVDDSKGRGFEAAEDRWRGGSTAPPEAGIDPSSPSPGAGRHDRFPK